MEGEVHLYVFHLSLFLSPASLRPHSLFSFHLIAFFTRIRSFMSSGWRHPSLSCSSYCEYIFYSFIVIMVQRTIIIPLVTKIVSIHTHIDCSSPSFHFFLLFLPSFCTMLSIYHHHINFSSDMVIFLINQITLKAIW